MEPVIAWFTEAAKIIGGPAAIWLYLKTTDRKDNEKDGTIGKYKERSEPKVTCARYNIDQQEMYRKILDNDSGVKRVEQKMVDLKTDVSDSLRGFKVSIDGANDKIEKLGDIIVELSEKLKRVVSVKTNNFKLSKKEFEEMKELIRD